ncbi:MAG: AMP-binding protein [Micrococcales bacterium]|nr:AMP-binding protein [Micrococcales bacterium]MCL2666365.1 AMP-binding protein [Micrococcales bacterium]
MTLPGVPVLVGLDSVPRLLDDAVHRCGADTAVRPDKDHAVSYTDLRRSVHAAVRYLDEVLDAPDVIAIAGPASYPWVLSFLAVVCSGRVAVPLDPTLSAQTVVDMARRAEASLALVDDPGLARALPAAEIKAVGLDQVAAAARDGADETDRDLAGLARVTPDSLALKVFTSGTAGVAKLVHLSHDNIASNAAASIDALCNLAEQANIIVLLPLHHLYGLNTQVTAALLAGATLCFGGGTHRFTQDLATFSPNVLVIVPMVVVGMYQAVWREAARTGREASLRRAIKASNLLRRFGIDIRRRLFRSVHQSLGGNLQMLMCGGAHLPGQYVTGFDELGLEVLVGYGITECAPLVAFNRPGATQPGTVGAVAPGVRVKIVDDEVYVRSPGVMVGYDNPDDTAAAFVDGWFRTGDKGSFDADGTLTITGRIKSLIIGSDGNNVDPEAVEQALAEHPLVESALVAGFQHDGREGIAAMVYPSAQGRDLPPDEVAAHVEALVDEYNATAAPFARVQRTQVVTEPFSTTSLGKVKRYLYTPEQIAGIAS